MCVCLPTHVLSVLSVTAAPESGPDSQQVLTQKATQHSVLAFRLLVSGAICYRCSSVVRQALWTLACNVCFSFPTISPVQEALASAQHELQNWIYQDRSKGVEAWVIIWCGEHLTIFLCPTGHQLLVVQCVGR